MVIAAAVMTAITIGDRDYRYPRIAWPWLWKWKWNDRYGYGNGNYGYRDEGYGGYNNAGIINRVMRDLQVASSRNRRQRS